MAAELVRLFKKVKSNIGSILLIALTVFLAVVLVAGMLSHATNYKKSAEKYFDENKMWDFKITSTLGFTREDVIAVSSCEGVKKVTALFSNESNAAVNANGNYGTKIYGINFDSVSVSADSEVSAPRLIKGSYPTNATGCVAVVSNALKDNIRIGDSITLINNTGDIAQLDFTVTGLVSSPEYASFIKDTNAVNDKGTELVIFVSKDAFSPDSPFNQINVLLEGSEELNCFSDEYTVFVNTNCGPINVVARDREQKRSAGINDDYNANIEKLQKQYDYIKSESEKALKEIDEIIKSVTEKTSTEQKRLENQKIKLEWQKVELDASKNDESYLQKKQDYEQALAKYQRDKENNDINIGSLKKLEDDRKNIEKNYSEKQTAAKKKLDEAKTSSPSDYAQKWTVHFREENEGFVNARDNASKIQSIFSVLPLFILMVAIITVMGVCAIKVKHHKDVLEILKTVAQNEASIKRELLAVIGFGAALGGVLGVCFVPRILPDAINDVLGQMYNIPFNTGQGSTAFAMLVTVLLVAVAVVSTLISFKWDLTYTREKEIDTEYAEKPFISKLPTVLRVLVRNILKEKYVFASLAVVIAILTVCSAFSLSIGNKLNAINTKQYNEIQNYDLTVELTPLSDYKNNEQMTQYLSGKEFLAVTNDTATIEGHSITAFIPEQSEDIGEFISNCDVLAKDKVAITHGFAKKYGIKKGSVIDVKIGGVTVQFTVSQVVKNYVGDYVFIHPEAYKETTGTNVFADVLLIKGGDASSNVTQINDTGIVYTVSETENIDTLYTQKLYKCLATISGILCAVALVCVYRVLILRREKEIADIKFSSIGIKNLLIYLAVETAVVCVGAIAVAILVALLVNLPLGLLRFDGIYSVSYIGVMPILKSALISFMAAFLANTVNITLKYIKK